MDTRDFIDWHILFFGSYEKDLVAVLKKIVKPGMIIIEAGANTGSETFILGKLTGSEGKVLAFEPVGHIYQKLLVNKKLNPEISSVQIFENALGGQNETISLYIADTELSNQGMSSKIKFEEAVDSIQVKQYTIDHFAEEQQLDKVDLIKIDVQGAEAEILYGASKVLAKHHPIIVLEADGHLDSQFNVAENLFALLTNLNYELFSVTKRRLVGPLLRTTLKTGNWIAFPK